ncbi:hypothetical protein TIFTF001_053026 [Ficus carica]|uniref:Uncharacterized protein n=1 Tax=Ficus carica TaxID=3494 RepID=A0AA88EKZ6_FICCA|nr:hypothetical protein TIFTF001_053026 [Ficus carica]
MYHRVSGQGLGFEFQDDDQDRVLSFGMRIGVESRVSGRCRDQVSRIGDGGMVTFRGRS